jgi:hypothetical protein
LFCVIKSTVLIAQNKKEQIEALRVAVITHELKLTPSEAQVFWPIYNEWQDKLKTIKQKRKEQKIAIAKPEQLSDKELENILNTEYQLKIKEAELYKEYIEKIKKVLPLQKTILILKAEEEFKKELIMKLKELN